MSTIEPTPSSGAQDDGRTGVLLRGAAHEAPAPELLARIEGLLGLDAPVEQVVTTTNTGDAGVTAALKAIAGKLPV